MRPSFEALPTDDRRRLKAETTGEVEAGEIFFCVTPHFRPNLRM
jgi:hypothetical protein